MTGSVRQRMLERLRERPATVREIGRQFGLTDAAASDHLRHALRSLGPAERLVETPAECRNCGFCFRKRDRVQTPSRCPRCRGERIDPPVFHIVARE